jgi:hypothetical protein
MQLRTAERKKAKIKMALQGCSSSGKTYSSLLVAQGLSGGNFTKVAIIDTENGSADLYSHLGNYNVITLSPPFTPERYIEAIEVCENAGMEIVILDSISHSWEELLDYHIIATMRTKQDYVLNQKDNKWIPEKVGLKAVQRDGVDYEFTLVFDIDIKHFATASKDRTGLFMGKPEFIITPNTGRKILEWCNDGINVDDVRELIQNAKSTEELGKLYHQYPEWYPLLSADFQNKKALLQAEGQKINVPIINSNHLIQHNGNSNSITAS